MSANVHITAINKSLFLRIGHNASLLLESHVHIPSFLRATKTKFMFKNQKENQTLFQKLIMTQLVLR